MYLNKMWAYFTELDLDLEFQVVSKKLVFFGMDADKRTYAYTHRQQDIYMHILILEE